jgi:hypothetical protein
MCRRAASLRHSLSARGSKSDRTAIFSNSHGGASIPRKENRAPLFPGDAKSNQHRNPRSRRSVADAEERAWVGFYDSIDDASIAAELIHYIEADPELKRARSGLYLRAKQSVRRADERYARARRFGHVVRSVLNVTVFAPLILTKRALRLLAIYATELLPEVPRQNRTATNRVSALTKKREFARAGDEFDRAPATDECRVESPKEDDSGALTKAA